MLPIDLLADPLTWTYRPVPEIRAARQQPPALPPGRKLESEHEDEPPFRYDVDLGLFRGQLFVDATSSSWFNGPAIGPGVGTLIFRQVPAEHGLPYTWITFGTLSARSVST